MTWPDTSPPAVLSPEAVPALVLRLAARLRSRHGFLIGPGEITDALRALSVVDLNRVREVRAALRAVLCASRAELGVFDTEFAAVFLPGDLPPPELPTLPSAAPGVPEPGLAQPQPGVSRPEPAQEDGRPTLPRDPPEQTPPPVDDAATGASTTALPQPGPDTGEDGPPAPVQFARLSDQPGAGGEGALPPDDLGTLLRAAGAFLAALRLAPRHRRVPQARGRVLDLRRTLRAAARTGGDPARLRWLGRPRTRARVLIVLDGSRSMGRDAALLLRFAQALHLRARRVEVYVFSTDLVRLTPRLRGAAPGAPLALPQEAGAWGGGTRIGQSLLRLARDERARVTPDTALLILSDGLDTGDPDLVRRAMRDLAARAGLVVWLSPLAGLPGYRPVQRAVAAALPHLDALLPASGLGDLLALPAALRRR
ncbi:VWA domain-containing protein [Deinococcus sp. Leaf326]|uniref:vWA domain-containing protein n=1 Tax=Deinococcus sp. Leaf326 TaxID=1736338 RepID=UPI0006F30881|nr:VWA domain-containing protein [Deinococcus sp. Leaf326]KQQ97798.1 hypothetical protein ASF71_14325 [Deinococcus sp. Leaf326]